MSCPELCWKQTRIMAKVADFPCIASTSCVVCWLVGPFKHGLAWAVCRIERCHYLFLRAALACLNMCHRYRVLQNVLGFSLHKSRILRWGIHIMNTTKGPEVLGALIFIFLLNKRERSLGMHCPRPWGAGAGKKCNIEKRRYGFERDARAQGLSLSLLPI